MNHAEFHAAVAKLASGRYFSTEVKATSVTPGQVEVTWAAYIDGKNWTSKRSTPEEALAELTGDYVRSTLDDIGEVPTVGDTEPPPAPTTETDNFPAEY